MGASDHLVISVKSTNEHHYYCNIYSYNKAHWDGFRDSWFGYNVNKAVKEISDWIQIGVDCFIPHQNFQVKSHSLPWFTPSCTDAIVHRNHSLPWFTPSCTDAIVHRNHLFHQFHRNKTKENMKLLGFIVIYSMVLIGFIVIYSMVLVGFIVIYSMVLIGFIVIYSMVLIFIVISVWCW